MAFRRKFLRHGLLGFRVFFFHRHGGAFPLPFLLLLALV